MKTKKSSVHVSLHVTIASLFIGLILVLGGLLSWQNYHKASDIILSGAEKVYTQISDEVQLNLAATYRPVVRSLQLLAVSALATAETLDERLSSLAALRAALGDRTSSAAIQVGYANGDYFIIRALTDAQLRSRFDVPAGADFVVDDIGKADDGSRQLQRQFFDRALNLVGREPPIATDYDPRQRPWYRQAGEQTRAITPYLFHFIGKVGTTLTLKTPVAGVVIAADISLDQLSTTIARHRITPSSEVVLLDAEGRALAYHDSERLIERGADRTFRMANLTVLGSPVLSYLSANLRLEPDQLNFSFDNRHWIGRIAKVAPDSGLDLKILMLSPIDELLSEALDIRQFSLLTTLLIVILSLPIVWLLARRIAGPLRRLAAEAESIRRFEFQGPIATRSFITEVDSLAGAMHMLKKTVSQFLSMINSLAAEKAVDPLLERVTHDSMAVSRAKAAVTFLVDDEERFLQPSAIQSERQQGKEVPGIPLHHDHPLVAVLHGSEPQAIALSQTSDPALSPLLGLSGTAEATLVAVPLHNRQGDPVGLLCLLFEGHYDTRDQEYSAQIAFMRALSDFVAVTIESRHLLKMQAALLDAFIKLIAGAIDAKSPYTGGHCQRVPELAKMLARAACDSDAPPFRDYQLSANDWEALHIASWLHDCGKVTTPEYVVDKATKLETLHDRIHEIRMRFEVLKRDAEIRFWKQVAAGGEPAKLKPRLEAKLSELDAEFGFVAACNEGSEFMAPELIERLHRIAARTWRRTLDDRLGISWEEKQRKERVPAPALPTDERLIDNKPEHLIEREESDRIPVDNPWGFKLDAPKYRYNRGELYNLEVARGTLTSEERYKINDHIVQTIIMLEKLPYPKHLRDVPVIAGCHHETMDGRGYPRCLSGEQMSLTARMMAIADIFEALTASDRPYKKAKTLSEAIRILGMLRDDRHIDPDLFNLFLSTGIWHRYGEQHLKPEQLDEVDIDQHLQRN